MEIKTGKQFKLVRTVTEEMTAASVGSGDLRVLATPVMIALFEESSAACLREFLDPEQTSVGVISRCSPYICYTCWGNSACQY